MSYQASWSMHLVCKQPVPEMIPVLQFDLFDPGKVEGWHLKHTKTIFMATKIR
jgi:hypothetical protein